ncbi:MAG: 50S ribosomal protein L11 methyltransferase, partial [Planctomycetota bacterium]
MRYLIRTYRVAAAVEDAVAEALAVIGYAGFALSSRSDGAVDCVCYLTETDDAAAVSAVLAAHAGELVSEDEQAEVDVLAACAPDALVSLRPGVVVAPLAWEAGDSADLVLRMPATASFGDGRHPTTRMVAALIEPADVSGQRVLDLGSGSGILAVLATMWGAGPVLASDIDPAAPRAIADLAAANGCTVPTYHHADLLAGVPLTPPCAVILANIYHDLALRLLADHRLEQILPHGLLLLSGISHQHVDAV